VHGAISVSVDLDHVCDSKGDRVYPLSTVIHGLYVFHGQKMLVDREQSEKVLMATTLRAAGNAESLLPQDRVRGLMGQAQDPGFASIEADDYQDTTRLYTKFAAHILTTVHPEFTLW
jgi:hypothetical protein